MDSPANRGGQSEDLLFEDGPDAKRGPGIPMLTAGDGPAQVVLQ